MMTYRNPKTGQEQQVGENESVRRRMLEQLGWKAVGTERQDAPAEQPAAAPKAAETEEPTKLPSHGQPPAKNVPAKEEKTK